MASITEGIKELREATGAGVLDCKKALEQTGGDVAKAAEILKEKGLARAAKKSERVAAEGRVEAYIHPGAKLATLVELNCETDFVARTEQFQELAHNLAMHIAAAAPQWVSREDIPESVIEAETKVYRSEMEGENKPDAVIARIIEGKLGKFYQQNVLLEQPYIRNEDQTIQDVLKEAIAKLGENIVIKRFARFQID
ncbi:MAG: translation elongation factor Ts [Chloroflexi bacterium]|jgi:elongation factor Ts|nr:translation elongation factor Ts [Chloroflexota bacterium]